MKWSVPLFYLLFSLIWAGCTTRVDRKQDTPDNLIHRDTMVHIMTDMILLDATVFYEQRMGALNTNKLVNFLHNSIIEKYQITRDQFEASFNYYQLNLEEFDKMFADVITRLTLLKNEQQDD